MAALRPNFWQLALTDLTKDEWEALCDGCGVCCLVKYMDDDNPKFTEYTDVACRLLDNKTGHCSNYLERQHYVPDCINLTVDMLPNMMWLPRHCAYKRRYLGQNLPTWHYLIADQKCHNEAMDKVGVRGRCISEAAFDHLPNADEMIEERLIKWVKI